MIELSWFLQKKCICKRLQPKIAFFVVFMNNGNGGHLPRGPQKWALEIRI